MNRSETIRTLVGLAEQGRFTLTVDGVTYKRRSNSMRDAFWNGVNGIPNLRHARGTYGEMAYAAGKQYAKRNPQARDLPEARAGLLRNPEEVA